MLAAGYRFVRDLVTVILDGIAWIWRTLWRLNRVAARSVFPGQSRPVQALITALAIVLELLGLWSAALHLAATH